MAQPVQRAREWSREAFLNECEDIRIKALEFMRTYMNREGEVMSSPSPDFSAAIKAIELKARLIGLLGDGRAMDRQTLERELDKLGFRLVPKDKPRAA